MKYISILLLAMGLMACGTTSHKDCATCKVEKHEKKDCATCAAGKECKTCDVKKSAMKTDAELTTASTTVATAATSVATTVKSAATSAYDSAASTVKSATTSFPLMNGNSKASTTCTAGADTRTIQIVNPTYGGCAVNYTKMGVETTVANAKADMGYCDRVAAKITTNLESASYTCSAQ